MKLPEEVWTKLEKCETYLQKRGLLEVSAKKYALVRVLLTLSFPEAALGVLPGKMVDGGKNVFAYDLSRQDVQELESLDAECFGIQNIEVIPMPFEEDDVEE